MPKLNDLAALAADNARPRMRRTDRKKPRHSSPTMVHTVTGAAFEIIGEALARGDRVVIPSFGTFTPAEEMSRDKPVVTFRLSASARRQLFDYLLDFD